MSPKSKTILLVDDEEDVLELIKYNLIKEGYQVYTANNGEEAIKLSKLVSPSLIIMDVMMPVLDGIEACISIREDKTITQPLIAFLTSRSEDYSQIAGFKSGADDYIAKPIRPRVLISKIEALFRRYDQKQPLVDSTNKLIINRERFFVEIEGEKIRLPKKEFELLEELASKPGKVFTREQILAKVWGDDTIVGERTVDVHIRKLREKLGNDYIRTIKGIGYTYTES